jgi:hypothetical protein
MYNTINSLKANAADLLGFVNNKIGRKPSGYGGVLLSGGGGDTSNILTCDGE